MKKQEGVNILEAVEQSGNKMLLHIADKEEGAGENRRIVEIRPSRRCCQHFPVITEEFVNSLWDWRGRKTVERIIVKGVATLILVNDYGVRGSENGAHRTEGPYLLVS